MIRAAHHLQFLIRIRRILLINMGGDQTYRHNRQLDLALEDWIQWAATLVAALGIIGLKKVDSHRIDQHSCGWESTTQRKGIHHMVMILFSCQAPDLGTTQRSLVYDQDQWHQERTMLLIQQIMLATPSNNQIPTRARP